MKEQDVKKFFLFGSIGLGVLIIAGLVFAIMSGPGNGGQTGQTEKGLSFNDDNDPGYGPGESNFKVHIFSDFQCPACKMAEPAFNAAKQKYGDRVRFVWNDFPLSSIHQNARSAALAARCAEDQGKFWEYHDKLYAGQDDWSGQSAPSAVFQNYATELGLDMGKFSSCLVNQQFLRKIQDDEAEGKANRVEGTPTFFIGNKRFVGAIPEQTWETELNALLQGS